MKKAVFLATLAVMTATVSGMNNPLSANFSQDNGSLMQPITNENAEASLIDACLSENESLVKYLVEHGADVNKENEYIETPLYYACQKGNEKIVKYLVDHGADINKENVEGKTSLLIACEEGHEIIMKYLVEHGADVNKENKYGETLLFYACQKKKENVVKYLLENGANVNKANYFRETPLFMACESGNEAIVKCLVEHGADVNKKNSGGKTALFYARRSKNVSLVKYLKEKGAVSNSDSDSSISDSSSSNSSYISVNIFEPVNDGYVSSTDGSDADTYFSDVDSDASEKTLANPSPLLNEEIEEDESDLASSPEMESNDAHNNTEDWKVFRRQRMFELYGPQQISDSSDSYRLFSDKDISKDLSSSKMIEESRQILQIYGKISTDKKRRNSEYSESLRVSLY